ncbi:MAG TPA: ABC transporter permease subunit [Actinomycetota bacterium]|nr:ABC transporter permease subunit [Actinomycetota bacterium]
MTDDVRALSALSGTWVVMRRELRALLQDRRSVTMMLIFGLLLPIVIANSAGRATGKPEVILGILTEVLVFPYIAGLQAALTAFVGEREHGTLGPLLATPLSNTSIFAGKLLGAAYLPSLVTSAVGFVAFIGFLRGKPGDPFTVVPRGALIEMVALSLVAGFAMVVLGLLFGSKAKSVRGAQAITAVVVFPVIFGVQLLALIVVNHTALFAWTVLAGLVVVIVAGLVFAARLWNREEALVSAG